MRAVRVERVGGPEVLTVRDVEEPQPGPGEAVVDVSCSGVNFTDVYSRTGLYPNALPFTPGSEGAGTVSAVGSGVTDVRVGDRVGWVMVPGSYAEQAVVPADRLIPLSDAIDDETAAGALLQGLTAHYLVRTTYPVRSGDDVLVHAAAGGMGLLLTQLVKHLGGRVIGTASTPEKADLARKAGADVVVGYDDVPAAVREFTDGRGVAVAYDGVGASTFEATLASLRPRGYFVSYGNASGPVPPFAPLRLSQAGSVFLTRPTLAHYVAERAELLQRAEELFGWLRDGTLTVRITGRYPLEDAARAHADIEGRRTTGKLILVP
ncbi:quinone oxidoreductase [Planosporangium flavigriseum]|uniref:Alcohol dehydrogenase n=1 Tax=Planosporangium flavigriseum TaxID=373681 RepID=A0A8J3LQ41_9ACTN|nr:quinone oxidoreductase [Planosporangium flavigriseum]NJC65435.1 quinone oxidoreductase [Planosporangium flavigriseum]GIG75877.1 alcohol dehydrogenase [Planosporangium flavigriseum]